MRCDECLFKGADGHVKCRFAIPDSDSRILVGCTLKEEDVKKQFVIPVYINKIPKKIKGGVWTCQEKEEEIEE